MRQLTTLLLLFCATAALPLVAQEPATAVQPATPSACLQATLDFQRARMKEASPINTEKYQVIQKDKTELARTCASRFNVETTPDKELTALAELLIQAAQPEMADRAIAKALANSGSDASARAQILTAAVRITLRQSISEARNTKAEKLVAELDGLPDELLREKIEAHGMLNSYYRADDIDTGIIRHSLRILELNKQLVPEQRTGSLANVLMAAHENLAEAWAGQEKNAQALELLRRAPQELAGIAGAAERLRPVLERYELVGRPAAPIEAPRWLNADASTTRMELKGQVTWVQFTAHWCGPCRESYPAVVRLQKRFGEKGFHVVMATQLYGYFENQRNLSSDAELAAIKEYFPKHGIVFPVAVSDNIPMVLESGRPLHKANINDANYKVAGIPQIQLVDKQGMVRLIMIGYDEANEERLASLIARLLDEPNP
jgi:thiol-disulfide isomerase/thioredoxin